MPAAAGPRTRSTVASAYALKVRSRIAMSGTAEESRAKPTSGAGAPRRGSSRAIIRSTVLLASKFPK